MSISVSSADKLGLGGCGAAPHVKIRQVLPPADRSTLLPPPGSSLGRGVQPTTGLRSPW